METVTNSVPAFTDNDAIELFQLDGINAYGRQVEVIDRLRGTKETRTLNKKVKS